MSEADRRPRRITVLTTGRQDWGILRPVVVALAREPGVEVDLVAGGMHLSDRHGRSIDLLRADGFAPSAELDWIGASGGADRPAADSAAAALEAVAAHLRAAEPDAIVLVGDRSETAAAAIAATIELVPVVHLHGGEQTAGAFDDALRHAITKLSHLHLVSSEAHARRVVALGEDPAMVHVVGAPGTDAAARDDLPDRAALAADLGLELAAPLVVVTVHPATLVADDRTADAVVAAMDLVPATYVITLPNDDPGAERVREVMRRAGEAPGRVAVPMLGERRYWGLLRIADAMLGNSSSGRVEAPVVGLPVVDVGERQAGRSGGPGLIEVGATREAVAAGLRRALDPTFRARLPHPDPALVDGHAGERAAHIIAAWRPSRPPRKAPIRVPE